MLFAKLSAGILELVKFGSGPDSRLSATLKFLSLWRRPICGGIFPISWLWSSIRTFKKDKLAILDGISPEKLLWIGQGK